MSTCPVGRSTSAAQVSGNLCIIPSITTFWIGEVMLSIPYKRRKCFVPNRSTNETPYSIVSQTDHDCPTTCTIFFTLFPVKFSRLANKLRIRPIVAHLSKNTKLSRVLLGDETTGIFWIINRTSQLSLFDAV